jgi:hypothetical protein
MSRLLFLIPIGLWYWVYYVVEHLPKTTPFNQLTTEQKRKFLEESKDTPIALFGLGILIVIVGAFTVLYGKILSSKGSRLTNPVLCLGSSLAAIGTLLVLRN